MRKYIAEFVKGCAICQSTKSRTTQAKPPLYPISTTADTLPFKTIALDFITKLPKSGNNDTILSITNQGCSKAMIFLPCTETIDTKGTTRIYAQHVFPHYSIPKQVISDRDTQFTAKFTSELCWMLEIKQNISTAYHPQTDGQSEQSNQWVEQYLRIYTNGTQDDWSDWLPIAQYTYNTWPSDMTSKTPFKLIMGFTPQAHQILHSNLISNLEEWSAHIQKLRWIANKVIKHAQDLMAKRTGQHFIPFTKEDKV